MGVQPPTKQRALWAYLLVQTTGPSDALPFTRFRFRIQSHTNQESSIVSAGMSCVELQPEIILGRKVPCNA